MGEGGLTYIIVNYIWHLEREAIIQRWVRGGKEAFEHLSLLLSAVSICSNVKLDRALLHGSLLGLRLCIGSCSVLCASPFFWIGLSFHERLVATLNELAGGVSV